jgi:hypothetical protein
MRENGFQRDAGKTMKLQAWTSLSLIKSDINIYIRNKYKPVEPQDSTLKYNQVYYGAVIRK